MNIDNRYRCPACGFRIFNRRCAQCERCGAALPPELLLTAGQIAALDAEHARNREARARAGLFGRAGADSTGFGEAGDTASGSDGDGGGGGGCD